MKPYTHEEHFPTRGRPENYTQHPDYDELPESVKCAFTPKEYAWMDDEQKRTLIQDMTSPEIEE